MCRIAVAAAEIIADAAVGCWSKGGVRYADVSYTSYHRIYKQMVSTAVAAGVAAGILLGIVAGAGYWWYRHRQKKRSLGRIRQLSTDIAYAVEEREPRNRQLLEYKLDAAENKWDEGQYRKAERIMEEVFRLVQLS
jgi:predicted deacetylase